MKNKPDHQNFINHLYNEKLQTQQARNQLTIQKLLFATALLGLGSLDLKAGPFDLGFLVYLVPWVALVFDFYIMGEDYSVKRLGGFLKTHSPDPLEYQWENWVARNRDPFSPWAMPILSTLLFAGAALAAWANASIIKDTVFWVWLCVSVWPSWIAFVYYRRLKNRVQKNLTPLEDPAWVLEELWLQKLTRAAKHADYTLSRSVFKQIGEFFIQCQNHPALMERIRARVRFYDHPEYLRNVDHKGKTVKCSTACIADFNRLADQYPELNLWFRLTSLPEGRGQVLMPVRWLCHLIGLRHTTVHLFIDHPEWSDCTFIQTRGAAVSESPGCFDLPVAGHVEEMLPELETLFKEGREELGIDLRGQPDIRRFAEYDFVADPTSSGFTNVEFRAVYRCRPDGKISTQFRPNPNEVASIALFSCSELEALMNVSPEHFATGLKVDFPLYLKDKN
jgi:isopentenyldiphosphate isomerase